MKKYIALLTALSILAATGTVGSTAASETLDGKSDTVSAAESEKKECLISFRISGGFNSYFFSKYYHKLVEAKLNEGADEKKAANEADDIIQALTAEYYEYGRLKDDELEAERQECVSSLVNDHIDSYFSRTGLDRNEIKFTDISEFDKYKFLITASLTEEQIKKVDEEGEYFSVLSSGDDIEKYKGKIGNTILRDEVRSGNDQHCVEIEIFSDKVNMEESECIAFAEEVLEPVGITVIKENVGCRERYITVPAVISTEQLAEICTMESVVDVYGTGGELPPTEEPTSEPTSEPSDTPTSEPILEFETGDINNDLKIDVTDLSELSLALIGDRKLSEIQQKLADVDKDGKVTLSDLARMRQYLSKIITSFD
ncbi:MAG: dockerin type I domain-containing protein [Oscillospiraceae bacterium]|nr:dockerin type I domain-containing protein [Oscillospiraceae bacterium]